MSDPQLELPSSQLLNKGMVAGGRCLEGLVLGCHFADEKPFKSCVWLPVSKHLSGLIFTGIGTMRVR